MGGKIEFNPCLIFSNKDNLKRNSKIKIKKKDKKLKVNQLRSHLMYVMFVSAPNQVTYFISYL